MSSLLNGLKQSFSNFAPLDETSKAIQNIENIKQTIAQASNNEQNAIKAKINDTYRNIGETSYKLYTENSFELEKITNMLETVKTLYKELSEKQAKLSEILSRYDEELKILRPAPVPLADQAVCPSCGNGYMPGEMLFCNNCGTKLPERVEEVVESQAEAVQQSLCPNCSAILVSGAAFCASCGHKI
jgi:DNA repair exonuclease SbcCD ATPase subunit